MLRIRLYKAMDANTILSWCQDEKEFYRWTAGILGKFPITEKEFKFGDSLMPFTAFDETGVVGFFTLRKPNESLNELRIGYVILNPDCRGKGYGKEMVRLGVKFAFELYGADKVSLGVFEDNLPAYFCYKAAGFEDVISETIETYNILGEEWKCKELVLKNNRNYPTE